MRTVAALCLLTTWVACTPAPDPIPLTLAQVFSDHAVLQRSADINVWGTATPGTDVLVELGAESRTSEANASGAWTVTFGPRVAGGPLELAVSAGDERIVRTDIVMGDVWLASGQSNMEWPVSRSDGAEDAAATANDPLLRHFKVPRTFANQPEETLAGGNWQTTSPENVGSFSAVGYYFARHLRESQDVPVGILNTSWGGSRIEAWMSSEALGMSAMAIDSLLGAAEAAEERVRDALEAIMGPIPEEDPGLVDGNAVWAAVDLDESQWGSMSVPALWEGEFPGLDGIAWYRTTFELTAEEAAASVRLGVGQIDDSDITYVNGQEVGQTLRQWQAVRLYEVPPEVLHPGVNTITVRVEDTGGGGGIYGPAQQLFVEVGGVKKPLPDEWRFRVGQADINAGIQPNHTPTILYNKMVHPILPLRVRGFIWYQGESNAGGEDAVAYRDQFQDMIQSWRDLWGQGDLPFLWVQLANFMAPDQEPAESSWAVLRESQTASLELPNTGQAVIIDIGEADDIHPGNKHDVGRRLALAARYLNYGAEDLVHSGPMYRSHRVSGSEVTVVFDHVGGGLEAMNGALSGFAVAPENGPFVWANARIVGEAVVVSSPAVTQPAHVRYAWGNNPDRANLYNAEGLPAGPFRTDSR